MSTAFKTSNKNLDGLHQQALNLLYQYATSAHDAARFKWEKSPRRDRVAELTKIIKRDLGELHKRLGAIKEKHKRIVTSAVLANPNHPILLQAGGDYYDFIDVATATLNPHAGELMDLLREESNATANSAK